MKEENLKLKVRKSLQEVSAYFEEDEVELESKMLNLGCVLKNNGE